MIAIWECTVATGAKRWRKPFPLTSSGRGTGRTQVTEAGWE
jgi:hypothetical protein